MQSIIPSSFDLYIYASSLGVFKVHLIQLNPHKLIQSSLQSEDIYTYVHWFRFN